MKSVEEAIKELKIDEVLWRDGDVCVKSDESDSFIYYWVPSKQGPASIERKLRRLSTALFRGEIPVAPGSEQVYVKVVK